MQINTLPVYSKLAEASEVPPEVAEKLPKGWRLYQHQLETYKALVGDDYDVIFNTALTGDGKSLAGQLPVLIKEQRSPLMAMYPTNELIKDQQRQLKRAIDDWRTQIFPAPLDSAELDTIMEMEDYDRRGDALMGVLRNNDVILTNPDIYHLIMHQFYTRPLDAPDRYVGPLVQKFGQFTFDEFHIFEAPQIVSVLNALLFIHEVSGSARPHKFLFLSATPGELMLRYLNNSGLQVTEIEGQYEHGETCPDPDRWRKILNHASIYFDTSHIEEWVEQHVDDILLPFFLQNRPGAKGAIIVNSVACAHRLLNRLRPCFDSHGLGVEPNTGLTSRSRRAISYEADLLIGTSTVDVGVDFQINFLLFESRDGGSFLQRLGRLGRHPGYERDGVFHPFNEYVAYAITPKWVVESLFDGRDGAPALLSDGETVDRERLNEAIRSAYPPAASFEAYARLWGKFQSVRVLRGLSQATIREQYGSTLENLQKRYETTFSIRLRPAVWEYKELFQNQRALLEEAVSFRGGSYFPCCLIDETEMGKEKFKVVDLFQVVANANLEAIDESIFYSAAEPAGWRKATFEKKKPLGFFRLFGWKDEREKFHIRVDQDLLDRGADYFGKALVLKGINLDARIPGLSAVNKRLSRREIPALLCVGYSALELKRRLRLPLLFALFDFESRDGLSRGCIAFGRQALLMQARLAYTKLDCGGGAIIT